MLQRYTEREMGQLWSEETKYARWLKVELTYCECLNELKIVPDNDWALIKQRAAVDIGELREEERIVSHDVVAFLRVLERSIGSPGRWVHFGLTSSDVVDTAMAMGVRESIAVLIERLVCLKDEIEKRAIIHKMDVAMGRTHGQHAEQVTIGFQLAGMYDDARRSIDRLFLLRDRACLGKFSGTVGMYRHTSVEAEVRACKKLGLNHAAISSQVVPRDHLAEIVLVAALTAAIVEKWATNFRNLLRPEIAEVVQSATALEVGSSSVPSKLNPTGFEKICGLSRVIRGYTTVALENVNLWHERDLTNSASERLIVPNTFILLDHILATFTREFETLQFSVDRAEEIVNRSTARSAAQAAMLDLVSKGVSRQEAHGLVDELLRSGEMTDEGFWLCLGQRVEEKFGLSVDPPCGNVEQTMDAIFERIGIQPS